MPLSSCQRLSLDHNLGPTETLKSKTLHLAYFVKQIKKQNKTKKNFLSPLLNVQREKKPSCCLNENLQYDIVSFIQYEGLFQLVPKLPVWEEDWSK